MSTPISKVFTKPLIPAGDKLTTCCNSKLFERVLQAGEQKFVCTNPKCPASVAADGKETRITSL